MPDTSADAVAERERVRREAARRKAVDAKLGTVLPAGTRDDTSEGWGEQDPGRDEELLGDVPPHHG